MIAILMTNS